MIKSLNLPVLSFTFDPPTAPESAEIFLPSEVESFGDGLWYVLKNAIQHIVPSIAEAGGICMSLIAIVLMISLLESFFGSAKRTAQLVGTITIAVILIQPANALINLGIETVQQMSEYGKLLLPVMTAALAAQGGATSSAALYAGTVLFDSVLSTALSTIVIPLVYVYMALSIANNVIADNIIQSIAKFVKWLMTWCLKIILYVFTGYISITGVVSGTVDAAAIKATKIAINGAVPVVGNIISDASEAILVSAGLMKNSAGVFGLLTILALWIGPFIQIAVQYLLLKLTAGVCDIFTSKQTVNVIKDFSGIMGLLLAVTGTMCLLLLISIVCFMRGVS